MFVTSREEIYKDYHDKVRRYFMSKVNDMYLAEDLCGDTFVKVYEKLNSFDNSKASISTWIFTIARNTLIDYFRCRRVSEEISEDVSFDFDIEETICNNEMLSTLAGAINKLEVRERDIIILRYYKGEALKDIALKMDISYAYVKILHKKALSELKSFMGNI